MAQADKQKVIVIGGGPIRIGQGIEFDYCCVHCVWALREIGYEGIIINNNPETVSTDFDTSDRLYFEPLTEEDCLNIIDKEQPLGVVVQFGGQTPINLAEPLFRAGVKILGTPFESIEIAEDRNLFELLLRELDIPKPAGRGVTSLDEAVRVANEIGYPVLVRPSFVLGGRAMEIVYNERDLVSYMRMAADVNPNRPVLVDKYVYGKEVEVDVIADGETCLLPGIMEHIERAGVHSGDSMAVYPPQTLSQAVIGQVVDYSTRIARALKVQGLMNVQYVVENEQVYVLEVNPRASRTVPYLSKITGVPMVNVATKLMLGNTLKQLGYAGGLWQTPKHVAVKAPVFSFGKLTQVDVDLGPEMKSTGEIMGIDDNFHRALYKAMVASGYDVPLQGSILVTVADRDKAEASIIIKGFADMGYRIFATEGTARYLNNMGIAAMPVKKIEDGHPNILDMVTNKEVVLLLNTPTGGRRQQRDGMIIRRASVEHGVPCLTSLDTARALLLALSARQADSRFQSQAIQDYLRNDQ
jgi:carbamoyl-phosphate synthase large subunit